MSPDDIALLFHTARRVRRAELAGFLKELVRRVTRGRSIACVVTGDAELRRLNRRFRRSSSLSSVSRH